MSVFTSRNVLSVDIPHDAGQSATVRQLAPRQLGMAAAEAQRISLAAFREMGGAAVLKEIQDISATRDASVSAPDPIAGFDRVTLVEKALVAWTYDAPTSRESIEDLDEETLEFLARAVLRLSKPSLFRSLEEQAHDQKNA